jgi:hypothetical protein
MRDERDAAICVSSKMDGKDQDSDVHRFPIKVENSSVAIGPALQLDFSSTHVVDHSVKVLNIGRVDRDHIKKLKAVFSNAVHDSNSASATFEAATASHNATNIASTASHIPRSGLSSYDTKSVGAKPSLSTTPPANSIVGCDCGEEVVTDLYNADDNLNLGEHNATARINNCVSTSGLHQADGRFEKKEPSWKRPGLSEISGFRSSVEEDTNAIGNSSRDPPSYRRSFDSLDLADDSREDRNITSNSPYPNNSILDPGKQYNCNMK